MGDRCWVTVRCTRRMYEEHLIEHGYVLEGAEVDDDTAVVEAHCEEANYANYNLFEGLAKAGEVFTGWHDSGDDYMEAMFVGAKGSSGWHRCINGVMACLLDEDGVPLDDGLRNTQNFINLRREATAELDRMEGKS